MTGDRRWVRESRSSESERSAVIPGLHAEARSAAGKIQGFLDNITDQLWRGS
jgi:hypothetical protein